MTDRPTPPGTTPEPPSPSPEPWKVALRDAIVACHNGDGWEADILSLISRHHDPSCPGPTPTRTERLTETLIQMRVRYHADGLMRQSGIGYEHCGNTDECPETWCAEARKALEVKP